MASWDLQESDLTLYENDRLGEGGFGTVYRANIKSIDQAVAAKKLKAVDVDIAKNVEVSLLQQMAHPNILRYFGAIVTKDKHIILVTELAEKGSLRGYLAKQKERLPDGLFFRWSLHGSLAVQYLQEMKVVHRDIKSPNFLIDKKDVLKLCDFGLARTLLIVMELPYSDLKIEERVMWAVGNENRRPAIPADVSPGLRSLLERCWDEDRNKRPHIDEVVHVIETE
ncbi:uncharacterized protein [Amphiura filiformis]|uniref:uncharacterized protein n=1 Tax=Amphiura filiformis TaxID=82378 RepID=UPI003B220E2D